MINFKVTDEDKQLVSIISYGNTSSILKKIEGTYPQAMESLYYTDDEQILFLIPEAGFRFSLNDLKSTVAEVAEAHIDYITVDFD